MIDKQWIELKNQKDLDVVMECFGRFHDSCIRELHMWTDHYVNHDLSMSVSTGLDHNIRLLVQRQAENRCAIELLFEKVTQLYIKPSPENYDSIIFEATFLQKNGLFYWADDSNWDPDGEAKYSAVNWICSKAVRWRDASEWLGSALRYGSSC